MNVKISTTNSKLGYQIPSVSLAPSCSCRPDAPCAKGCYGKKGNFTYKQAQDAQRHNYDCYVNDSESYFNDIISFLNDSLITFKFFRWHGGRNRARPDGSHHLQRRQDDPQAAVRYRQEAGQGLQGRQDHA